MSIQRKLQVADVYNRINRLKEEEKLIHVEMKQFIVYFGETIPNRLKASIEDAYSNFNNACTQSYIKFIAYNYYYIHSNSEKSVVYP